MIRVTDQISIDERDIRESFMLAGGPGGQNVNKVSSAVMLRFDARGTSCLPHDVRVRLERLAGKRITKNGVVVIIVRRHRTQERNRAAALAALVRLIRRAALPPARRLPTRPSRASVEQRLQDKARRACVKAARTSPAKDE
jgi:ribosome-associated protein